MLIIGPGQGLSFLIFFNVKVCCLLCRRGDSNEYTQYTTFNIKKKIILNYPKSFETAMVNQPSVFKTPKFYCNLASELPEYLNDFADLHIIFQREYT